MTEERDADDAGTPSSDDRPPDRHDVDAEAGPPEPRWHAVFEGIVNGGAAGAVGGAAGAALGWVISAVARRRRHP